MWTLTYDPLGRLFQVVKGAANTRFFYDGDAMVVEYDANNIALNRYAHGSNAAADDPLVWFAGSGLTQKKWLHSDQLGSIVAATDASGANPSINRYDEYGIPQSTNVGRFQYTGQMWLSELSSGGCGLYYYKARMYAPCLGRFLQTDPVGYEDGINLYEYVGNDPVNRTDPTGNDAVWMTYPDGTSALVIPVQFSGSAATSTNVAAIVARVNSLTIGDPKLRVQVVATSRPMHGFLNKLDFSPGKNTTMCGSVGECANRLGGDRDYGDSALISEPRR